MFWQEGICVFTLIMRLPKIVPHSTQSVHISDGLVCNNNNNNNNNNINNNNDNNNNNNSSNNNNNNNNNNYNKYLEYTTGNYFMN